MGEAAYAGGGPAAPATPQLPQDLSAFATAESSPKEIEVGTSKNQIDITIP